MFCEILDIRREGKCAGVNPYPIIEIHGGRMAFSRSLRRRVRLLIINIMRLADFVITLFRNVFFPRRADGFDMAKSALLCRQRLPFLSLLFHILSAKSIHLLGVLNGFGYHDVNMHNGVILLFDVSVPNCNFHVSSSSLRKVLIACD